jgi:hypothetical protein
MCICREEQFINSKVIEGEFAIRAETLEIIFHISEESKITGGS